MKILDIFMIQIKAKRKRLGNKSPCFDGFRSQYCLYLGSKAFIWNPTKKEHIAKIKTDHLERTRKVKELRQSLYSKITYSPQFKRHMKIMIVQNQEKYSSILCSTDLTGSTQEIFRIYSARFQIEYLFRDGKSYLGLGDAQVRKEDALNLQNNAGLTALNLLKLEHHKHQM